MNQEEFSTQLENAYKEALKQADLIVANAEQLKLSTEAELSEAKKIRMNAELEAEKILQFTSRTVHGSSTYRIASKSDTKSS